jgi:hypothetical protein
VLAATGGEAYSYFMRSLSEIEAAAEALPVEQKKRLFDYLALSLRSEHADSAGVSVLYRNGDALLVANPGSPPMTPDNIKRLLEEWP